MTVLVIVAVAALWAGVVLIVAACIHTDPPARLAPYQPRAPHPN